MTIETTKASRGRSMKTFEITAWRSRQPARRQLPAAGGVSVAATTMPGRTFWMPLDDHPLAFLQSVRITLGALRVAELDAPRLGLVVAVDDQHVGTGLVDLQRAPAGP